MREMLHLKYKSFFPPEIKNRKTGELIFSRHPILEKEYQRFQKTSQDRGLLRIKVEIDGIPIHIFTSQLEVGASATFLRRAQVEIFESVIKKIDESIIFGGDTGILEYQRDISQPKGCWDAWYEAGSESTRYTYDSITNLLVPHPFKDRPDRVWYRMSEAGKITCQKCKLIGDNEEMEISSHYGVLARFG